MTKSAIPSPWWRVGAVLVAVVGYAVVAPPAATPAAAPSASCTDGLTRLDRRIGDGKPQPGSLELRALQVETARGVARVVPGSVDGTEVPPPTS